MDESILQKFYEKLIGSLPMKDTKFTASLYSAGLLPGDLKAEVESKSTTAKAAAYFLDYGIKNKQSEDFGKLLEVMQKSEFSNMKKLAEEIQKEIDECK